MSLYDRLAVILIHQKKFDEAEFFVADVLSRSPDDFFGNLWASQILMFKKECVRSAEELSRGPIKCPYPREVALAQAVRQEFEALCKR